MEEELVLTLQLVHQEVTITEIQDLLQLTEHEITTLLLLQQERILTRSRNQLELTPTHNHNQHVLTLQVAIRVPQVAEVMVAVTAAEIAVVVEDHQAVAEEDNKLNSNIYAIVTDCIDIFLTKIKKL